MGFSFYLSYKLSPKSEKYFLVTRINYTAVKLEGMKKSERH